MKQEWNAIKQLTTLVGRLFQPILSDKYPDHYESFIDADAKFRKSPEKMPNIDAHQPSQMKKELKMCTSGGCRDTSS